MIELGIYGAVITSYALGIFVGWLLTYNYIQEGKNEMERKDRVR